MMRFHIPQGDGRFDRPLALFSPLHLFPTLFISALRFYLHFPKYFSLIIAAKLLTLNPENV